MSMQFYSLKRWKKYIEIINGSNKTIFFAKNYNDYNHNAIKTDIKINQVKKIDDDVEGDKNDACVKVCRRFDSNIT